MARKSASRQLQSVFTATCFLQFAILQVAAAEPVNASEIKNQEKASPPSKDIQVPIRDEIKRVYGTDKAKTTQEKVALARELQKVARDTIGKLDERFVELKTAAELAADAGDVVLCMEIIDELSETFEFDSVGIKQMYLVMASTKLLSKTQAKSLLDYAVELAAIRAGQGEYDEALALAQAAQRGTAKAQDETVAKKATEILAARKQQHSLWLEYVKASEKLVADPNDAKANLLVGRWLAVEDGNWEDALAYFEKCGVDAITKSATGDRATPATPQDIEKVADQWFNAGDKGGDNSIFLRRAAYWYQQLELVGSGLAKAKAERRRSQIESHAEISAFKRRESLLRATPPAVSKQPAAVAMIPGYSDEVVSEAGRCTPFRESVNDAVLVGFDVSLARFGISYRGESIGAIRPLFLKESKLVEGEWHGKVKGETARIIARPGYAVGDVNVAIGGRVMGLEIQFQRLRGLRGTELDGTDNYSSGWIGKETDKIEAVAAGKLASTGIYGSWRSEGAWPSSIASIGLIGPKPERDTSTLIEALNDRFGEQVKADGLVVWIDPSKFEKRLGSVKQTWTCRAGTQLQVASGDLAIENLADGNRYLKIQGKGLRIGRPLLNKAGSFTYVSWIRIPHDDEAVILGEVTSNAEYVGAVHLSTANDLLITAWNKKFPEKWMKVSADDVGVQKDKWHRVVLRRDEVKFPGKVEVWIDKLESTVSCHTVDTDRPGYAMIEGEDPVELREMLFFQRALSDAELASLGN